MADRYFVDLFAGSGGLSLGLEHAGFTPILVNEINGSALETYLSNRDAKFPHLREKYTVRDSALLVGDDSRLTDSLVRDFRTDFGISVPNGELDLVVGGPPCQGFSTIGHRRTYASAREAIASNHLYKHMAEVIRRLQPKLFLFENVSGLKTASWRPGGRKGEIWDDVLRVFREIPGYECEPYLVHAKDYGVPQNRPRILIVGRRNDLSLPVIEGSVANGLLPGPTDQGPDLEQLLSDLIDPAYVNGGETIEYPHPPLNEIQHSLRESPANELGTAAGDPLTEHKYSRHNARVLLRFEKMIGSGGVIDPDLKTRKFSQRLLPRQWSKEGPTITVTSLPDDYVHFAQPRTPTVREWARMQTFPDWYQFAGPRTTGGVQRAGLPHNGFRDREVPKYTQIGNAVPVALAKRIGEHFIELLGGR